MKKVIASFKKYPKSWMYFGAAVAAGIGFVSGAALPATTGLIVFIFIVVHLGKVGAGD